MSPKKVENIEEKIDESLKNNKENKPKTKKEKLKNILYYAFTIPASVILGFHALTLTSYSINNYIHSKNPSELRQNFKEKYGIELIGWKSDIEENKEGLKRLEKILDHEKERGEYKIRKIRIISKNYLKKNLSDQLDYLFKPIAGYFSEDLIAISNSYSQSTITHEIKHAKVKKIVEEYPDLKKIWSEHSKDDNGNSLYLTEREKTLSSYRGLERFLEKDKKDLDNNRKLGFITNYARTNVGEDIAELCEIAELEPQTLFPYLYGNKKNNNLIAKIKIAQAHFLIPEDFYEKNAAVFFNSEKNKIFNKENKYKNDKEIKERINNYIKLCDDFSKENPNSKETYEIMNSKANSIMEFSFTSFHYNLNNVIDEYKKILFLEDKNNEYYLMALQTIAMIHQRERTSSYSEGLPPLEKLYRDATSLYFKIKKERNNLDAIKETNKFLAKNKE